MTIEEIAGEVMRDWRMGFSGIELDFAIEVARLAVAAEREACAKVCEDEAVDASVSPEDAAYNAALKHAADAIRERSNCAIEGPEQAQLANGPSRMES